MPEPDLIQPRWKYFYKDYPEGVISAIETRIIGEYARIELIAKNLLQDSVPTHFSIKMIKIFITGLIGPLTWTDSVVIRPVSVDFNRLNSCMNPTIWTCQVLIYYVLILTCLHLYKCTEIEILWSYHRYKKCTRVGSTSNRMPCRSSCFDFQTFWTSY